MEGNPVNLEQPNSNMRRLKRIPADGKLVYTLETEADRKRDNLLCHYCAWKLPFDGYLQCPTFKRLYHYSDNIGLLVRTCSEFQPILTFRPPTRGLDRTFNTFRLGTAWANRLSAGNTVGLMDAVEQKMLGKARVLSVFSGHIQEMCDEHADQNHAMLGTDRATASERMMKLIRQSYGKLPLAQTDQVTVIYLENLCGDNGDTRTPQG